MYPLLIVVTSLFLSLLLILYYGLNPQNAEKHKVPPSPTRLPIIGNLHQLGSSPHQSLCKLSKKYGPLMFMHLGSTPTLVVSSEEAAQEVFKTHDLIFSDRLSTIPSDELFYRRRNVAFAPYGEYWREVRKISVLQVLSAKRVESFRDVREEVVACMVEKISQASGPVDLKKIIISTTGNIFCMTALGKKYYEEKLGCGTDFQHLLEELFRLLGIIHIGDLFPSLAWIGRLTGLDARLKKNFQLMDEFLEQVIEEHMAEDRKNSPAQYGRHADFVDILLEIQRDGSMGVPLDRDNIKAVILDNFAGGTDTIYLAIIWTLSELIRHPTAMKKVQEEIRSVVLHRNSSKVVTEDEIRKMPYLKCVIKESLRLHPPAPLLIPRKTIQDVEVQGFHIPAKTPVLVNTWAIGRDPKTWTEPEKFLPERFLDSEVDFKGQHFKLIPFGAGRRGCPGIPFATATIEIVVANVLHRFDWELPAGEDDLDMTEVFGMSVHKKSLLLVPRPHY
ncbi:hypothetical protein H6P81_013399 [Aristolochia fimbriata]|uniref:Cytochrome P450 n=1 Tax=Aristolochia fimbriata TaxID=158543 RepID=A0AAV7EHS6_ARIFI|nr:hypothetical protein H6P81_013399 [Aristolochia fimbriata]